MSGEKEVTVSIEDYQNSIINKLDASSAAKILFVTPIQVNEIIGTEINCENLEISINNKTLKLSDDLYVNGNLTLTNGMIDIDGNYLSIIGDLVLNGTDVDINNGFLDVSGNLFQKSCKMDINEGFLYIKDDYELTGSSKLIMQKEEDYIHVCDNMLVNTTSNETGLLTNGILEIEGNFSQLGDKYAFVATGNHLVVFDGNIIQTIFFEDPETSYFNSIDTLSSKGINCCYDFYFDLDKICSDSYMISFLKEYDESNCGSDIYTAENVMINYMVNTTKVQYIGRKDLKEYCEGCFASLYECIFSTIIDIVGELGGNNTISISSIANEVATRDNYYYLLGKCNMDDVILPVVEKVKEKVKFVDLVTTIVSTIVGYVGTILTGEASEGIAVGFTVVAGGVLEVVALPEEVVIAAVGVVVAIVASAVAVASS